MQRPAPPAPSRPTVTGTTLVALLKLVWAAFVVATPVLGAWVASSLAAYSNGPVWLAVASGLLLFPVAPVAWELVASWRRARRASPRPRVLTRADRLILRTLALNLCFLAALVAKYPQRGFVALETRGDWMLDGRHDAASERARRAIFHAAGGLEWLYVAARPNPYRDRSGEPHEHPHPTPSHDDSSSTTASRDHDTHPPDDHHDATPSPGDDAHRWPFASEPDPLIAQIPASAEASIESVGHWFAEQAPDPWRRTRALHDWVADRIAYDAPAYASGTLPAYDGDAEHTFTTRVGVCAGYARLLQRLGRAAGLEVEYVVGDGRPSGGSVNGESHAWNAVKLEGRWYLIDATWDAGSTEGSTFRKRYSSQYFLTPPDVFALSHFPDDPEWQLLDRPLSRGDFFRAPMLAPEFFAQGLALRSPLRSQVTVDGEAFPIDVDDPRGLWMMATVFPAAGGQGTSCVTDHGGSTVHVRCTLPGPGSWDVRLYAAAQQYGSYPYVGQLAVNRSQ